MYQDSIFCFDALKTHYTINLTNKNRTFSLTSLSWRSGQSTYPLSGNKVYFEFKHNASIPGAAASGGSMIGFAKSGFSITSYPGATSDSYSLYLNHVNSNILKYTNNNSGGTVGTYAVNDVFGVAVEIATGKFWFSRNGVWQNSGDPVAGTNPIYTMGTGPWYICCGGYSNLSVDTLAFDAQDLVYLPPEGFYAVGGDSLLDYTPLNALAYWPLNETSGSSLVDIVAGYTATLEGGATINQSGVFFQSQVKYIALDGADDRIIFPSTVLSNPRMVGDWSIECFVKVVSAEVDDCIWYVGSSLSDKSDEIALVVGGTGDRYLKVLFRDSANGALSTLTATSAAIGGSWGQWLYVVVTKSGTDTCSLYVNGALTESASITGLPNVARTVFRVGCDEGSNYSNIHISNFAVHTTALTSAYLTRKLHSARLIYTHYLMQVLGEVMPVAYWALNEPSGSTVYDYCKNGYDGTVYGTVTFGETSGILAPYDKSIRFNGSDGCIEIAHAAWNGITGNLTLEAWIKHDSSAVTADEGIITKYLNDTGYTNSRAYALVWQSDGKVAFNISSNGTTVKTVTTASALSTNTWYYISAVFTPSSKVEIFVNGVSSASSTSSIPSAIYASTAPVFIGNQYYIRATGNTTTKFSGWICGVGIHNKLLTAANFLSRYTAGAADNNYVNSAIVTLNPSDKATNAVLANNNFIISSNVNNQYNGARATLHRRTGKFYFEVQNNAPIDFNSLCMYIGLSSSGQSIYTDVPGSNSSIGFSFCNNSITQTLFGTLLKGVFSQLTLTPTEPYVWQIAVDLDESKIWVGFNNVWFGDPAAGTGAIITDGFVGSRWAPFVSFFTYYTSAIAKFAPASCTYSPPAGFSCWDMSGISTGHENVPARVTRSFLNMLVSCPNDSITRVTRSNLSMLTPAADHTIGEARCSKLHYGYILGYSSYIRTYTHQLHVICRKTTGAATYKLSGTVKLSVNPLQRTVRAHKSADGAVLGTAVSNAETGYFEITTDYTQECYVVCFDDPASPDLQSIIYDRVFPVLVT